MVSAIHQEDMQEDISGRCYSLLPFCHCVNGTITIDYDRTPFMIRNAIKIGVSHHSAHTSALALPQIINCEQREFHVRLSSFCSLNRSLSAHLRFQ
jgi:hypothetical protein